MAIVPLQAAHSVGAYRLESLLGESMGEVWTAWAPDGTRVVLKTTALAYSTNAEILARFENEALHLEALRHRHIVPLVERLDWGGRPFLVLAYLPGGTLAGHIDRAGAMSFEQTVRFALPLLDVLGFLHERGVIHRDIKPDNILFDADGVPYLADFGLACVRVRHRLTRVGAMLGTPGYMSPEQRIDPAGVGPAADSYSFAVTLFEALTGRLPEEPWPKLPAPVAAFFRRALEEDPNRRFASAAAMRDALLSAQRRPVVASGWAVAAVMLLGALVGGGAIWWVRRPAQAPTVFVQKAGVEVPPAQPDPAPAPSSSGPEPRPRATEPSPATQPGTMPSTVPAPAPATEPIASPSTPPGPVVVPPSASPETPAVPAPKTPEAPAGQNGPFFPPVVVTEEKRTARAEVWPGFPPVRVPRGGNFRWVGHLKKNQVVDIAPQSGEPLPGLPVSIRVLGGAGAVSIAESPSPDNGWARLRLRSKKEQTFALEIYWETNSH